MLFMKKTLYFVHVLFSVFSFIKIYLKYESNKEKGLFCNLQQVNFKKCKHLIYPNFSLLSTAYRLPDVEGRACSVHSLP